VLDGKDQLPTESGTAAPSNFSAHVYCVYCGKVLLRKIVGLSPGHIVLDGDLDELPPGKRGTAPNFRPMSVVAKRLYGSRCHLVSAAAAACLCHCSSVIHGIGSVTDTFLSQLCSLQ